MELTMLSPTAVTHFSMLSSPEKVGLGQPGSLRLLSTSCLTQLQAFSLLQVREVTLLLSTLRCPISLLCSCLVWAIKISCLRQLIGAFFPICWVGCCLIYESLNKTNELSEVYLVGFCFLTLVAISLLQISITYYKTPAHYCRF